MRSCLYFGMSYLQNMENMIIVKKRGTEIS